MSMGPPNWAYSMMSMISFIMVCIPFPWHLEAWNTGTCLYMAWTAVGLLNGFINSIVWNGNALNPAPVWCDISARIIIAINVAIPAASLCINRRLYLIASVQKVTTSKQEKRRAIMVDCAIGLGIPFLEMILQYIPQGHRFDIFEDIGCYPMTYNTPMAYPFVFGWPLAIGLVSAVYSALTIRALAKRRSEFQQLLSSNRNLNSSRYLRLMGLAGIELCLTIPTSIWALYLNTHADGSGGSPVQPWKGWADTHSNFSFVGQYPAIQWKANPLGHASLELGRWALIICAFIFFGFFGFADEARKNYKLAVHSIAKKVGYTTLGQSSGGMSSSFGGSKGMTSSNGRGTLPVFIRRETTSKRDSFASFSTNLTIGDVGGALDDIKVAPYSPTDSDSSSSRRSLDEKADRAPSPPPMSHPEPALDIASPPYRESQDGAPARPDSYTIV